MDTETKALVGLLVLIAVILAVAAVAAAVGWRLFKIWRANAMPYGRWYKTFIIAEGTVGVLATAGRFERVLQPGSVTLGPKQTFHTVPTGERTIEVLHQELITTDRFQVRIAATVIGRVSDPQKYLVAAQTVDSRGTIAGGAVEAVTRDARLALRTIVSRPLDQLLTERPTLDAELAAALAHTDAAYGFRVEKAVVRDVILPPEVRRALTEAERNRLEALALLERARGEQATLRSLANAARMLKNSPELMNLRLLQTVESIDPRKKVTVVLGEGAIAPVGSGAAIDPE